jgi:bifunctional DNA-binding transcriptional regulator/antitoxin component of YhaV-PrlF toxin-antitoxin module
MTDEPDRRAVVNEDGTVEIPASLRAELDIEPGDTLTWDVTNRGPAPPRHGMMPTVLRTDRSPQPRRVSRAWSP